MAASLHLPAAAQLTTQRDPAIIRSQIVTPPPPLPAIAWTEFRRDSETVEYRGSYPSAFPTSVVENQTVPVWLFIPSGAEFHAPFPAVVALHYLGAGDISDERALAHQLNKRGVAALTIALPYHLSRAPEGQRSGHFAVTPDPQAFTDVMVQSVLDVRRAVDQLLLRPDIDPKNLGIAGISLGSLIAELTYGIDSRVKESAFLLGGTGLAHILWTSSLVIISRETLRREGLSESKLKDLLGPIEPGEFLRQRLAKGADPAGSNLVIGGKFDTVIPPSATSDLISTLNSPTVISMDTGHYGGIFARRRIYEEVATFFAAKDFGDVYVAPKNLSAPTLRLLAQAVTPVGFDIGIGIDLFKTREQQEFYGCAALTPHGPELIFAKSIVAGFSLGLNLGLKGPGAGIFWSAVL